MHRSVTAGTQDEDQGQATTPRGFKHHIALALIERSCSWRQAHKAVDLFFHSIKMALRRHETVDLPFGTFSVAPSRSAASAAGASASPSLSSANATASCSHLENSNNDQTASPTAHFRCPVHACDPKPASKVRVADNTPRRSGGSERAGTGIHPDSALLISSSTVWGANPTRD